MGGGCVCPSHSGWRNRVLTTLVVLAKERETVFIT